MRSIELTNARLQRLGLAPSEATAYRILVEHGSMGAQALAGLAQTTKTTAYNALRSLSDAGLVEAGAGYSSSFTAVDPEYALPALVLKQKESAMKALEEKELLAGELASELAIFHRPVGDESRDVIEILRNPRSVADRVTRLMYEAESEILTFVKAPIITAPGKDPDAIRALKRGVRIRSLFEEDAIDSEHIAPYVDGWATEGEEMRLYPGELPLKAATFDGKVVVCPLVSPGARHELTCGVIRHPSLALALGMLFEDLWQQSVPLSEVKLAAAGGPNG